MQNIIFVGADESETKVVAKMLAARKNLEFISTDDFFGEGIDEIKKIPKADCSIYVDIPPGSGAGSGSGVGGTMTTGSSTGNIFAGRPGIL